MEKIVNEMEYEQRRLLTQLNSVDTVEPLQGLSSIDGCLEQECVGSRSGPRH